MIKSTYSKPVLIGIWLGLAACSPNHGETSGSLSPMNNTGDPVLEALTAPTQVPDGDLKPGLELYVVTPQLRARKTPDASSDANIAGTLELNDKLVVVDPNKQTANNFIGVRVLESNTEISKSEVLYVSLKFLDKKRAAADSDAAKIDSIFIVQNVATEKLRVYRKCEPNEGCVNKMLLETDDINGEDQGGTRTDLGFLRIQRWEKFYEDGAGLYPAWYRPGYPAVPPAGSDKTDWLAKKVMPGGHGDARGAFGWYTAIVGPNSNNQWTHGTYGWGADKKEYINFKNSFWIQIVNLFASIRSHGCTRVDNESIAYLRKIVPVGAAIVKIYAREGYRDASLRGYTQEVHRWNYVMTKIGAGTPTGPNADRADVMAQGVTKDQIIEEGTYEFQVYPQAQTRGRTDLYGLGKGAFQGAFLVDEGTLVGYAHPGKLGRVGYGERSFPSAMLSTSTAFTLPPSDLDPQNEKN